MWMFTRYGFFSVVCARLGDGSLSSPPDPDRVMVRARHRDHLTRLIERFPEDLGSAEIVKSVGTDYPVRLFIDKAVWCRVVEALSQELDYDNFKSEIGRTMHGQADTGTYLDCLHEVWAVMQRLER